MNYTKEKYVDEDFKLILGNEIYLTKEGMSQDTYEKGDNPALHEFLTWYLNQADLTDKSKDRTFTSMVSNIAAEDGTKGAITFKGIDPDIIRKY